MENESLPGRRVMRGCWRVARGRAGRVTVASALLLLILLLVPVLLLFGAGGGRAARASSMATPTPPPRTLIVQPQSGMVRTKVTLTGFNFPPGSTIQVGYATGNCSNTATAITGVTGGMVDAEGNVTITFRWPQTPTGSYYLCATDSRTHITTQSQQPFQVLTPGITITSDLVGSGSPVTVYSGHPVTVKGTNFLPTSALDGTLVQVLYAPKGSNGCAHVVDTATVADDGTFTLPPFNAPQTTDDTSLLLTIIAVEPPGTCGQTDPGPVLFARIDATVSPLPGIQVPASMPMGQVATVTGQHFLPAGSPVEVDYGLGKGADPCTTRAGTARVQPDGSFSFQLKAPLVLSDTPITVVAIEPAGSCRQPQLRAGGMSMVTSLVPPWVYCLIGLLLLLLLLLLLFLLFRRRKKDEPGTIEERDRVVASPAARSGSSGSGLPGARR